MTEKPTVLIPLLIAIFFIAGLSPLVARAGEGPFQGIVGANAFHLRPAQVVTNAPPGARVGLKLNGIWAFAARKRALLRVELPAHPPEPARVLFLMLAEGQGEGAIKVLEIDSLARTVRVLCFGTETRLSFEPGEMPRRPVTL